MPISLFSTCQQFIDAAALLPKGTLSETENAGTSAVFTTFRKTKVKTFTYETARAKSVPFLFFYFFLALVLIIVHVVIVYLQHDICRDLDLILTSKIAMLKGFLPHEPEL
jgi:hypothetical protein